MNGDLLKLITNENYKVNLANLLDKKLGLESAKEMNFDEKALGIKSTRDKTLINSLKSPAIMTGSLKKISFSKPKETKTRFLSSNPEKFYDT